ncbi:MAG: RelA/SpoT domain-containing protein [Coriobacteriia bacterium]|nr:RelA/SpoT domain-containing protein [Coriobacteriia bacterium]
MTFSKPKYKRNEVRRCGKILASENGLDNKYALDVADNWRSSHLQPVKTFLQMLQRESLKITDDSTSVFRLKRLPSIVDKLGRLKSHDLASMQDIGGCRTVLDKVSDLYRLRNAIRKSEMKHKFIREYDYIITPKPSGYRGIHLIYKYYSDKNDYYNGLNVEIQIRTKRQHAWATCVEVAGDYLSHSFKSSQGPEEWLNFFKLASSAIAILEKSPTVVGTPNSKQALKQELRTSYEELKVKETLRRIKRSHSEINKMNVKAKNKYFLVDFNEQTKNVSITSYREKDIESLTKDYLRKEEEYKYTLHNVVVVSGNSIESLRYAYGNYFADVDTFLRMMDRFIK